MLQAFGIGSVGAEPRSDATVESAGEKGEPKARLRDAGSGECAVETDLGAWVVRPLDFSTDRDQLAITTNGDGCRVGGLQIPLPASSYRPG